MLWGLLVTAGVVCVCCDFGLVFGVLCWTWVLMYFDLRSGGFVLFGCSCVY